MNKFIITFAKEGYIRYISHLDTVRLFERGFKRGDIKIQYSQGFNPHPKMVFAQPLSLGYFAENEKIEIETKVDYAPEKIKEVLEEIMPRGLIIKAVTGITKKTKTLASLTEAAEYTIDFGMNGDFDNQIKSQNKTVSEICQEFMERETIISIKQQKKTGKIKEINIRPMIKSLYHNGGNSIKTVVSQGSDENLSPELLIKAFLEHANINCSRDQIDVTRNALIQRSN